MEPVDDYPLGPEQGSPPPALPSRDNRWRAVTVTIVALVLIAAAAFYFTRRTDLETPAGQPASAIPEQPATASRGPLGADVEARDVPPLDLSDPFVRDLLKGLSSRPELAAWLATDGLIRNIVATVDAIANGTSPSTQLRRLAPAGPFRVEPRGDDFVIDARSYRRYDGIADTVASLDAQGIARAYSILRPRLQEAYRELGYPEGNFDDAVERAIVRLLNTPVVDREVDVQPAPVLYQFTDPGLERLAPAQKQLLRMGPRNGRLVHDKLREIALALGIRAERMP